MLHGHFRRQRPLRHVSPRETRPARLVEEAAWFDALAVRGKRPVLALLVEVEEVFGHCAEARVRSRA